MADAITVEPESFEFFPWIRAMLKEEIAPYPGRGVLVSRMVLAATIVMIVNMTFRIPFGAYGAIYAFNLSRESPEATLKAVRTLLISFSFAVGDVLIGAVFFSSEPLLRVLWVAATLFVIFFALSALSDYTAAARFGYLLVITIPLWDLQIPAELKVENTLWAIGALSLASVITAILEIIFHKLKPWDDLTVSIAERLEAIKSVLNSYVDGTPDKTNELKIQRLSMLGTSRMRRNLQRSGYSPEYAEKMGAVVAYVGRLVDITANLIQFSPNISENGARRFRTLSDVIENVCYDVLNKRIPPRINLTDEETPSDAIPLLREMEITTSLIAEAFNGTQSLSAFAPSSGREEKRKTLFVPDAFTESRHLHFGLKGGLAAFLCYITYNLVGWHGISTAVTTCLLTALTTIGSSHQKQVLRFSGAFTGGGIAMMAQIFVLPSVDSIAGCTVLFVAVTTLAAWLATSGPRLSYFGVQVAVAFYLINLVEFKFQTSLAVARDRVVGIMLGLFMMWLVFDHLWCASAVVDMKRIFKSNLRLLARLTQGPVSQDLGAALEETRSLRESINGNFDRVRQQSDGVLLEFGSSREHDLTLRAQLLRWQFQLQRIFLVRVAMLKYRLRLPGFELPEQVQFIQMKYDNHQAAIMEAMADRLDGKATLPVSPGASFQSAEQVAQACCPTDAQANVGTQLTTFIPLAHRLDNLIQSLSQEIQLDRICADHCPELK
jgi:multidrug resistance protein MdtO